MLKFLLSLFISTLTLTAFASQPSQLTSPIPSNGVSKASSNILHIDHLLSGNSLSFALKNPTTGRVKYTKNGIFLKRNGYFYQGEDRLQGFSVEEKLVSDACMLTDVKAPEDILPAKATALISTGVNLDGTDSIPSVSFDINNPASYNYKLGALFYTPSGKSQELSVYFVKSLEMDRWTLQIYNHMQFIGEGSLVFNHAGEMVTSAGLDNLTFKPDNTNETQTVKIDLYATQYASPYKLLFNKSDGYPEGNLIQDSVDSNGYISQHYTNGVGVVFSKIAVYANR